eukprot:4418394-Amphidinium_carterae.2
MATPWRIARRPFNNNVLDHATDDYPISHRHPPRTRWQQGPSLLPSPPAQTGDSGVCSGNLDPKWPRLEIP